MSRRRGAILLCLAVAAGALAFRGPGVRAEDPPASPPAPPAAPPAAAGPKEPGAFAGAASCKRCHPKEWAAWAGSPHATGTAEPRRDTLPPEVLRGGRVEHPPGASQFVRGKDGAYVVETVGADGTVGTFPLSLVVGGVRMRMFVTRLNDGRLQVLPSMREDPDGPWFDYTHLVFGVPGRPHDEIPVVKPGDGSFWTGPVRSFDARCARCHVSGREPVEPAADGTGPRSSWRALGVDCEACHGPCGEHGRAWSDLSRGGAGDPVLKLQRLDRDRALSSCLQCHMEGEMIDPAYEVGERLLDHLEPTLLDDPDRADPAGRPVELLYEGLSFLTSRCAEQGKLTCSTCHEPHGGGHRAQTKRSPDGGDLCVACHADLVANPGRHSHHEARGSGARCMACHLPPAVVERGHGAVTDHAISTPGVPGARGAGWGTNACVACHSGGRRTDRAAPPLDVARLRDAYVAWWPGAEERPSWADAIALARAAEPASVTPVATLLADRGVPSLVRASAAALLGRFGQGASAPLLAAAQDPDVLVRRGALAGMATLRGEAADAALLAALLDPAFLVRSRAARSALAGWERVQQNAALLAKVVDVLKEEAEAVPDDDMRWFRLGAAREVAGDVPGAIAAYERQVALDPYATTVRAHLEALKSR